MKKQFFVAAMAIALGAGLTACSSDNLDVKNSTEVNQKASTYMSVSFELPATSGTRAADDKQDDAAPEFNNVGKWAGQDKVKSLTVYVFNGNANTSTLEIKQEYSETDLGLTQNAAGKAVVNANKAFKVTPGTKTVFVVVNPTQKTKDLLEAATITDLEKFKEAYASKNLEFANTTGFAQAYTANNETCADELAKVDGTGTDSRDIIVMTGPSVEQPVEDNVSEQQAVTGVKNRAALTVQRAVSRVVVTTLHESYPVEGIDPNTKNIITDAATVSQLTYVVAQGEKKLYFLQKDNAGADGAAFTTPAFDQIPANNKDYWTADFHTSYNTVGSHYDYSGLWKQPAAGHPNIKGIKVPTRTAYSSVKDDELKNVTDDLKAGLKGEFVLPTLHKFNADRDLSGYKKGNTAYILVRGLLTPKYYVDTDGSIKANATDALPAGTDLYLGANGVFYKDKTCVRDASKNGVPGQTAQLYKGGKVLYFVWINPDNQLNPDPNKRKAINSPVIRNNIYHVQIKAIGKIGANWNPLVPVPNPSGPNIDKPNDPSNPVNNNPNNPDPRPKDNPFEPETPPVDPKDPLTLKETWMSVNVSILPWQVHSYEVTLSI